MSVLAKAARTSVVAQPYPHLVVEDAIDPGLCRVLIEQLPALDFFTKGRPVKDNWKFNATAVECLRDPRVSEAWKALLNDHLSADFFWTLEGLFHDHLVAEYPSLRDLLAPSRSARIGVLRRDSFERCDILLDAIIGLQTPVHRDARLERLPHVKGRNRLITGFLYLRYEDDHAAGGDFELYSRKPQTSPRFGIWRQTPANGLLLEKSIPYRNNTLVVTMNSPRAIQGVSARGRGSRPLLYMHFLAQVKRKLFDLDYSLIGRLHESAWDLIDPYK